jgi:hypothetical protein
MLRAGETIIILLLTAVLCILILYVHKTSNKNEEKEDIPGMLMSSLSFLGNATRGSPSFGGDDRYTMAPRPQRVWDNGPEIPVRGALDPIPTRGEPERYQQMGVIVAGDGKALPLYGRRTAPRSDRFQYYTRTDTYNPVALPISHKKRDCQDGVGCDELMSGDDVKLAATGEEGKVTLYGFDGPRYIG